MDMKLSAPKNVTWIIALAAGGLGVAQYYRILHFAPLGHYSVPLIVAAWALLLVGTFFKGI
jgi:hypothetical protein